MRTQTTFVALFAACSVGLHTPPAHACSGPRCAPVGLVRDAVLVSATIPANAPGIGLVAIADSTVDAAFSESSAAGARSIAFLATPRAGMSRAGLIDLVFQEPLHPGATLSIVGEVRRPVQLDSAETCTTSLSADWSVGDAAPLPETLGTLEINCDLGDIQSGGGSDCYDILSASRAHVRVELAAEAQPWQALLAYETLVDGELWNPSVTIGMIGPSAGTSFVPGGSTLAGARGEDLLYRLCDDASGEHASGLAAGPHALTIRARVPGTDTWLSTAPVTIALPDCSAARAASETTSKPDEGAVDPQASPPQADGPTESSPTGAETKSGGCSLTPRGLDSELPGWLVIVLGTVWRRRLSGRF